MCDNYLRGYYGLKLVTKQLLELMPQIRDLDDLPATEKVEYLNEVATLKLWEIVKRGFAEDKGWDGNDQAELVATRELLDQDELDILKNASTGN